MLDKDGKDAGIYFTSDNTYGRTLQDCLSALVTKLFVSVTNIFVIVTILFVHQQLLAKRLQCQFILR